MIVTSQRNRDWVSHLGTALLSVLPLSLLGTPTAALAQSVNPDTLLAHVKYLASDELAGRESGESGADAAAAYIARAFESYRLEQLGNAGYLQPFEITTTIAVGSDSRLVLQSSAGRVELELYEQWLPFNFSGGGEVTGDAFNGGFGLKDEEFQGVPDDPYVMVLRGGTPDDFDPHSSGMDPSPRRKATTARDKGAAAVLITVSRIDVPQAGDPPHSVGIPVIQLLETEELQALLESPDLKVTLDAKAEPLRVKAYNIAGRLQGRDPAMANELIVVGAHYDHLGMGGPGSMAPDAEEPHNGADDNASGTSVLLGLAKYFAQNPEARPARSLAFVAFAAEEMGLLGSEYFVSHPPFRLEDIVAMVNFDMVGRLKDGKMQIFGTGSAEEFTAMLDSLGTGTSLDISYVGDGYGPSDQTSFYARDIPVLHFFTGTHSQYHRPDDDWELINADGMAQVTDLAIAVIDDLGNRQGGLTLVKQERPVASGGGGYGPYLGTIPDFGEVERGGLRLSGVRAGSPAENAGLQAGDVVIEFGGKEVLNIYDYTYALREHAPGDTVMIRVRRDGDEVELTAVLGKRN